MTIKENLKTVQVICQYSCSKDIYFKGPLDILFDTHQLTDFISKVVH